MILSVLLLALWLYQFVASLQGWRRVPPLPPAQKDRRFLVLIAAHNEEQVIGHLLDSLNEQTHPKGQFDVHVSCDRCTDGTQAIARQKGAKVLIKADDARTGKTWNIRWALEQIPLDLYDSVVILDADNLVRRDFLERMNDYLEAYPEAEAIQGYLDVKNPDDSWVTMCYAISYWYTNRFWQLSRARWGLSATLGGTGLLIRVSTLRRVKWDLESLTEDLEFSARLILGGGRVHWNQWAIAYDEKPVTLRASFRQRKRWLQGHYWVLWHYGFRSLARFFKTGRVQYFDLFLYLLAPAEAVLFYLLMFGAFFSPFNPFAPASGFDATIGLVPWLIWAATAFMQCVFVIIVGPSFHRGEVTFRYLPALLFYFWFGLTWMPIVFQAAFTAHNQGHWVKTKHSRSLTLAQVVHTKETRERSIAKRRTPTRAALIADDGPARRSK